MNRISNTRHAMAVNVVDMMAISNSVDVAPVDTGVIETLKL